MVTPLSLVNNVITYYAIGQVIGNNIGLVTVGYGWLAFHWPRQPVIIIALVNNNALSYH